MKVFVFLMFFFTPQLFAVNVHAQSTRLTIQMENVTIKDVLIQIENQTEFSFLYNGRLVNVDKTVSVNANDEQIDEILNRLFPEKEVTVMVVDRQIVLQPSSLMAELNPASPILQGIAITGQVTDKTGDPLPGVTVSIKGANRGTVTDAGGAFKLQVPDANTTLTFSYIGFVSLEIIVGNQRIINISLVEDVQMIDEVVVVGYGTQTKMTITGAIASVNSEDLKKRPVSGISNTLIGLISGIQSIQTTGEFGMDAADVRVRGIGTLNTSGGTPLIMVDGVERSTYNDIDPNEIETLNVLKDASATAVFGVRGANGVIMITTKQGKVGKPKVSATANVGALQPSILPNLLNSYDYAVLRNEAQRNMGRNETFSPEDLELYRSGADPVFHPDHNWLSELIKPFSFQQNYNANLSGGTEKVRYFASLGYFNQYGGYNEPEQSYGFDYKHNYDRYNVRMNFDFDLTKDFMFFVKLGNQIVDNLIPNYGAFAAYDKVNTHAPMSSPGFVDGKLISQVSGYPVGVPVSNPWYNTGAGSNRAGAQENQYSNTVNVNIGAKYKLDRLLEGLAVRTMVAYDTYYMKYSRRLKYFPTYTVMKDPNDTNNAIVYRNDDSGPYHSITEFIGSGDRWRKMYGEAALDYAAAFNGVHNITGLVLANIQKGWYPNMEYGLPTAYLGLVGRVTYQYANKYLSEFNIGYNGSENFPKGKRYGLFPSFSLGWVVTEESFLTGNSFLSFLKIRGSYGEVGNDKIGGNRYMYLNQPYSLQNPRFEKTVFGVPGANQATYDIYKEGRLGNPDVTWERAKKSNAGIDMALWKDRINITVDYFIENRNNILWNLSTVPELVATTLPYANIGKVRNYGYELEAGFKDKIGTFSYWIKGLYSFARNKIVFQDEEPRAYEWMKRTGKPVGQFFGLVFEGYYNTQSEIDDPNRPVSSYATTLYPGDMKYRDLNGDGKIDQNDVCAIGYPNFPEVIYSGSLGGSWNGFDFSALFQGASNVSVCFDRYTGAYPFVVDWGSASDWQLERWEQGRYERGEKISYPRLELSPASDIGNNYQRSSFWVQDGSYLRLKTAELGYRFNPAFLNKKGIESMRVYFNGSNLYTWKNMRYATDPDTRETWGRSLPSMRVFNFGINFQF